MAILRSELRSYLLEIGHDPLVSENSDILFDPRQHTHANCIQEIASCDYVMVFIGSRFGGTAVPSAVDLVDWEKLRKADPQNRNFATLLEIKPSITQLEVIKAIEHGIPVMTFVEQGVYNDHFTYEKNKVTDIAKSIIYPNIDKQESARYIFEFINYVKSRSSGNAIISFSRMDDIKNHVKRQLSSQLQRLLADIRQGKQENQRLDFINNAINDIKAALLATAQGSAMQNAIQGAIRHRHVIQIVDEITLKIGRKNSGQFLDFTWANILKDISIVEIVEIKEKNRGFMRREAAFIRDSNCYFRVMSRTMPVDSIEEEWNSFISLRKEEKAPIHAAVTGTGDQRRAVFIKEMTGDYKAELKTSNDDDDIEDGSPDPDLMAQ